MPTAAISSKSQLTLPAKVRDGLGVSAGDKIDFLAEADGSFRIRPVTKLISPLKGRFAGRVKKPVTIDEMNQAIARAASGQR